MILIILAVLGGLALWYLVGLLGSAIGLAVRDSNDWAFGGMVALFGPLNLIATIYLAIEKSLFGLK